MIAPPIGSHWTVEFPWHSAPTRVVVDDVVEKWRTTSVIYTTEDGHVQATPLVNWIEAKPTAVLA